MATTLLDLIVVLWPLAFAAAAWAIFINTLAETDEISKVVEALTRPKGVEDKATPGDVSLRRKNFDRKRRRKLVSVSFQLRAAYSPQHIKGERSSDEKNTFARRWSLG
jgi:hypothetical protein